MTSVGAKIECTVVDTVKQLRVVNILSRVSFIAGLLFTQATFSALTRNTFSRMGCETPQDHDGAKFKYRISNN